MIFGLTPNIEGGQNIRALINVKNLHIYNILKIKI